MAVREVDGKWYVVKSDGKLGKRGFSSKANAEAAQRAGNRLAKSNPLPATPRSTSRREPAGGSAVAGDPGTRNKVGSVIAARVGMEPVLEPRASDLAGLLEGFHAGLAEAASGDPAPPDFTPDPMQDSDDVQVGKAMGRAFGAWMKSKGLGAGDWKRLQPKNLGSESVFDVIGLGGTPLEQVAESPVGQFVGGLAGGALSAVTGGILGGEGALIDVIPGEPTGGGQVSLF